MCYKFVLDIMACNGRLKRFPLVASRKMKRVSPAKLIEISCKVVEVVDHSSVIVLSRLHIPSLTFIKQIRVFTECRIHLLAGLGVLLASDCLDSAEVTLHGTGLHGSHGRCRGCEREVEGGNTAHTLLYACAFSLKRGLRLNSNFIKAQVLREKKSEDYSEEYPII
jgi:hypothetical protein